jgi:hypothetical protein
MTNKGRRLDDGGDGHGGFNSPSPQPNWFRRLWTRIQLWLDRKLKNPET